MKVKYDHHITILYSHCMIFFCHLAFAIKIINVTWCPVCLQVLLCSKRCPHPKTMEVQPQHRVLLHPQMTTAPAHSSSPPTNLTWSRWPRCAKRSRTTPTASSSAPEPTRTTTTRARRRATRAGTSCEHTGWFSVPSRLS